MQRTQFDTIRTSLVGYLDEAPELFAIEVAFLGKSGKRTFDIDIKITQFSEHRHCAKIRNAHAAHAGIEVDMC